MDVEREIIETVL